MLYISSLNSVEGSNGKFMTKLFKSRSSFLNFKSSLGDKSFRPEEKEFKLEGRTVLGKLSEYLEFTMSSI
jgi:hypothetical protein